MVALARLTEEEACLIALMEDRSGVDLVEFAYYEPTSPDGCYRLLPYQWYWWVCEDRYQIASCARDVGKTERILARAAAWPLACPGFDLFITAPGQDHLNPVVTKVEERINKMRLTREMLDAHHGKTGIKKVPSFEAIFKNRSKIITRLPKATGVGVKGQHAKEVMVEEGQDFHTAAWTETFPTLREDLDDAMMLVFGVTNGLGNDFDHHANSPDSIFTLHRKIQPERPTWSDTAREAAKSKYKTTETGFEYQRNIFGHSQGTQSDNFVVSRLMACVRIAESDWAIKYNNEVYQHLEIEAERLYATKSRAIEMIGMPAHHHLGDQYSAYWGGWDIGVTREDSEVLVVGQCERDGKTLYRLLTRITMRQIPSNEQVDAVRRLLELYGDRMKWFSLDRTGVGLPMYEALQAVSPWFQQRVRGWNFSEKVLAGWEDRDKEPREKDKDLELHNNVKIMGLEAMREIVDAGELELPMDQQLLRSWLGVDPDDDHALDAGRMLGMSIKKYTVDAIAAARKPDPPGAMWGGDW